MIFDLSNARKVRPHVRQVGYIGHHGNDSYRVTQATANSTRRIKAERKANKASPAQPPVERSWVRQETPIVADFKALRLHSMASAWAELIE